MVPVKITRAQQGELSQSAPDTRDTLFIPLFALTREVPGRVLFFNGVSGYSRIFLPWRFRGVPEVLATTTSLKEVSQNNAREFIR